MSGSGGDGVSDTGARPLPRAHPQFLLAAVLALTLAGGCGRIRYELLDGDGGSIRDGEPMDADAAASGDSGAPSSIAITSPNGGVDFATDTPSHAVSGTCATFAVNLGSTFGAFADDDCSDGTWSLDPITLSPGGNTIRVTADDGSGASSEDVILIIYVSPDTRYRSASPGAGAPLASGADNPMTIAGITATFRVALPEEVGLGDAIQYDRLGDGSVDSIAFVHGRLSSRELVLRTADGLDPPPVAGDVAWSLFRAHTSLQEAVHGVENAGIDPGLRGFDDFGPTGTDKDLTASGEVWNIACYENGADTTAVVIDSFTTDAAHYLAIFTPTLPWEVGTPQRHRGTWDTTKYRLVASDTDVVFVATTNHVRVDGLQVWLDSVSADNQKAFEFGAPGVCDFRVSNSIFRGVGVSPYPWHSGLVIWSAGSGTARIWNNVAYDFEQLGGVEGLGFHLHDPEFEFYVHNNTAYGNRCGFGEDFGSTVTARNNLSYGNTFNYCGNYTAESSHNLSGPTGTDAPGSNPRNAATVEFVDEAGDDFHLAPTDTAARGAGFDLSTDPILPVRDDIDGNARPGGDGWDLGADEI